MLIRQKRGDLTVGISDIIIILCLLLLHGEMLMAINVIELKTPATYPAAEVEACLRDALTEGAEMDVELHGKQRSTEATVQGTVPIQLDSLSVVETLCAVEPTLGFELPATIVRPGGYSSIDQAIVHIMSGIEQEWCKRKGGMA